MMALNSPIRFLPAIGVMAGAHYRTLLMFFMFQKIKEHFVLLSHLRPVGITDAVL